MCLLFVTLLFGQWGAQHGHLDLVDILSSAISAVLIVLLLALIYKVMSRYFRVALSLLLVLTAFVFGGIVWGVGVSAVVLTLALLIHHFAHAGASARESEESSSPR
jgi:hypothetical protein